MCVAIQRRHPWPSYADTAGQVIAVVVAVIVIDLVSARIRKRLI